MIYKIYCIENKRNEEILPITIGKAYEVYKEDDWYNNDDFSYKHLIINDNYDDYYIDTRYFLEESLYKQKYRQQQINKLLDNERK